MKSGNASHHRGYTLIELLVVVFVLAVVAGLALPAVQSARESSRRLECTSQLRQISIALQSYVAREGFFPPVNSPTFLLRKTSQPVSAHCFSPLARMLADLGRTELFAATNFSRPPAWPENLPRNDTVMRTTVNLFLCPSDRTTPVSGYGRVSYRFCLGPSPWKAAGDEKQDSWTGPFTSHRAYRPGDFRDGLSQTIGASERIQGDWVSGILSAGDYRLTPISTQSSYGGGDWAVSQCRAQPADLPVESRSGESWFLSGFHFTNYNHCAPPNAEMTDCAFAKAVETVQFRTIVQGVFTARSRHPGGVNTARMDGSVRFVTNTIDLRVWRALSTRSGGETFTDLE